MSSLWPNLEICIHFLYSITFLMIHVFSKIIVLITLESTRTQIRMGVCSITIHARRSISGQFVFFMPKS